MGNWYTDKKRTVYVGTYENEKDYKKDAERAAKHGWVPQATTQGGDKVRAGRTAGKVLLTGGLGLLIGGRSKAKGKITATFVRQGAGV